MDRFDGTSDFSLWSTRMLAHLSVLGLKDTLVAKSPLPALTEEEEKDAAKKKKRIEAEEVRLERCDKAKNLIFLNVGDHVMRKIDRSETAAKTWLKLEKLYMAQALPNRVHSQLKFYTFKMQDTRTIDENIDDFLKVVSDLSNLSIEVPEEVQAILLLSSLPSRYDQLKETLKYSRDGLKLDEVVGAARSKERQFKENTRFISESHYAKGRSETKSFQFEKGRNKSRSTSREGKRVCWICGKEGHFKKQYYKC